MPSAEAEALVTKQRRLLVGTYGEKGRQIISDAQAYADGINAYWEANNIDQPPATVNDVIAVTAFIGSIFGAGGGGEAANADLLAKLQESLGPAKGYEAWDDVMLADDPEAPTTIDRRFNYGPFTGGTVTGSVVLDPDSIQSIDPRVPRQRSPRPHRPAGRLELPGRRPVALGDGELARGDGAAARLLLPGDRAADRSPRARHQRAGRRGARPRDVHPDRAHARTTPGA